MMRARSASIALLFAGGIVQAQAAGDNVPTLESCFQAVRVADATCSNLPDADKRVDCSVKAQKVEFDCLEHVMFAGSHAPAGLSDPAQPAPPAGVAAPKASSGTEHEDSTPMDAFGSIPAAKSAARSSEPGSSPPSTPPSLAEAPSGSVPSDTAVKKDERLVGGTNWIVSDTTSPVDFSPLLAAVIHSVSGAKNGQDILSVRCRSQHTEVSFQMDGTWTARQRNKLQVDYQINDHQPVRQRWVLSADGRTAIYKGDPVELLQSIPEDATLKLTVTDKQHVHRQAIFRLVGLSTIRQKVAAACKWMPVTARTLSHDR